MLEKLYKGYERFRDGYFQRNRERLEQLADQQKPEIAMVSCCDSRVDPGILFDVEPGEIFVIRNVANLVPCHLSKPKAITMAPVQHWSLQ